MAGGGVADVCGGAPEASRKPPCRGWQPPSAVLPVAFVGGWPPEAVRAARRGRCLPLQAPPPVPEAACAGVGWASDLARRRARNEERSDLVRRRSGRGKGVGGGGRWDGRFQWGAWGGAADALPVVAAANFGSARGACLLVAAGLCARRPRCSVPDSTVGTASDTGARRRRRVCQPPHGTTGAARCVSAAVRKRDGRGRRGEVGRTCAARGAARRGRRGPAAPLVLDTANVCSARGDCHFVTKGGSALRLAPTVRASTAAPPEQEAAGGGAGCANHGSRRQGRG